MRSSLLRPRFSIGAALILSALALSSPVPAASAAPGKERATTSAPAPTVLSLTRRRGPVRYGARVTLTARLTASGSPLAGREIALERGPLVVAKAVTDARGRARFPLKAIATGTYDARFTPSPQDLAAFAGSVSSPLEVVVGARIALELSSPLRAGSKVVGIARERLRVSGTIAPYASRVTIRISKHGRALRKVTRAVTRKGAVGRFGVDFVPRTRGSYAAVGTGGGGRSRAARLLVVRTAAGSGSRGAAVRALQRRLSALGYLTPVTGAFGASTARAVLAFRKVNGMERNSFAGRAVFRKLERGGGAFHLRYPNAGQHVEFDWSRQVLVLADGARVVRIVHASSGKPSTPTVFGTFHFYSKTPGFNAKGMYYSNYFVGGYAIHGYASVPPFAASHGCVRIPIASAIAVYRWINLGDRISLYR
jgi:L,D-transpeptidase catalytic domain/Putative peptidoglycan binding domain